MSRDFPPIFFVSSKTDQNEPWFPANSLREHKIGSKRVAFSRHFFAWAENRIKMSCYFPLISRKSDQSDLVFPAISLREREIGSKRARISDQQTKVAPPKRWTLKSRTLPVLLAAFQTVRNAVHRVSNIAKRVRYAARQERCGPELCQ